MLRHFLALAALFLTAASLIASETPVVTFEESVKDLGGIPRGNKPIHHFKFTNNTQQSVHIAGVRTSCHCATGWAVKNDIAPGESSSIGVQVDSNLYNGTRDFTIYVNFDRPYTTESRLLLKTVSRDDINLSPNTLSFGVVKMGSAPSAEITLEHRTMTGWKITGIENDNGYIQPKLDPLPNHPSGYKLSVRLREDTPSGVWHASIGLVTNDASTPRIRIPLSVEVQGLLAVKPEVLHLGELAQGTVEKKVVVRGAKPFKILSVEGADDTISVDQSKSDEAKVAHVLRITYSGKADTGELLKKLKIVTDLDKASVELPVHGTVRK